MQVLMASRSDWRRDDESEAVDEELQDRGGLGRRGGLLFRDQ